MRFSVRRYPNFCKYRKKQAKICTSKKPHKQIDNKFIYTHDKHRQNQARTDSTPHNIDNHRNKQREQEKYYTHVKFSRISLSFYKKMILLCGRQKTTMVHVLDITSALTATATTVATTVCGTTTITTTTTTTTPWGL